MLFLGYKLLQHVASISVDVGSVIPVKFGALRTHTRTVSLPRTCMSQPQKEWKITADTAGSCSVAGTGQAPKLHSGFPTVAILLWSESLGTYQNAHVVQCSACGHHSQAQTPLFYTSHQCECPARRRGGNHSSPSGGKGKERFRMHYVHTRLVAGSSICGMQWQKHGCQDPRLSQGEGTRLNALQCTRFVTGSSICSMQRHKHVRQDPSLSPQPPSCGPKICAEGCALTARQPDDRPRQRRAPPEQGRVYNAASHPAAAPTRQAAHAAKARACSDRLLVSPRLSPAPHAARNDAGPSSTGSHRAQDARQRVPEPLAVRRHHRQLLHIVVHAHDEQLAAAAAAAVRAARAAALHAWLGN